MPITQISATKVSAGWHKQFSHHSDCTSCDMRFAIFLPPQAQQQSVPVLYWLSGLTCTDENFMQKAAAFKVAAQLGIAIVAPDTSPRGDNVPDDINGAYDFGLGAGFYLNATQPPFNQHYQMYDYVVNELPSLIEANFPVNQQRAISGHSMGGHGALSIAFKNPSKYSSVSAFSPICQPTTCPWGQKALLGYLGDDKQTWLEYDSSELIQKLTDTNTHIPALVDQGRDDIFLAEQLNPQALIAAAKTVNYPLELRMQQGYDHSYFFISSFIEDHLQFHAANFQK